MKELEKMDILRKRLNVSYSQAKDALDECGGDLVDALVYLERQGFTQAEGQEAYDDCDREPMWDKEKTENFVRGAIDQIKSYIQEGNVTKVRLIHGEKVLFEIPATFGVVGIGVMLFSPLLLAVTALGAAAAMAKEMVFEVEKADGAVERRSMRFPGFGGKTEKCCDDPDCCADGGEEEGGEGKTWYGGDD